MARAIYNDINDMKDSEHDLEMITQEEHNLEAMHCLCAETHMLAASCHNQECNVLDAHDEM